MSFVQKEEGPFLLWRELLGDEEASLGLRSHCQQDLNLKRYHHDSSSTRCSLCTEIVGYSNLWIHDCLWIV